MYRTIVNYSDENDAYSRKICKQYGFKSGAFFTIKVKLLTQPGLLVLTDFLSQVIIISYVLRIVENPLYDVN